MTSDNVGGNGVIRVSLITIVKQYENYFLNLRDTKAIKANPKIARVDGSGIGLALTCTEVRKAPGPPRFSTL